MCKSLALSDKQKLRSEKQNQDKKSRFKKLKLQRAELYNNKCLKNRNTIAL